MKKNKLTLPEGAILSDEYSKFGYEYKTVTLLSSECYIEFPLFCSVDKLNAFLLELMDACITHKGTLKASLTYADAQCISLTVNGRIYLNYSIECGILLPPEYALKLRGIKIRDVKRSVKRVGGKVGYSLNTVRFAAGGIRIDVIKRQSSEKVTVKVAPRLRKTRKFTK